MKSFKDKTVVITGGATGIGFALAKQFAADGAKIVIGEPREERLKQAADELAGTGAEVFTQVLDVSDAKSVESFADFAWQQCGSVHVLINNAGVGLGVRPIMDVSLEDLHRLFGVNFFGVWHGSTIFGKRMIEQGEPAAIYNLGSENSLFNAMPRMAAYIASKHAVRGLTEALRDELPDFIDVGLIIPGFVKSEMTPPPFGDFAMEADAFAEKVMQQIRDGAFYIVGHAYNIERVKPIHEEIERAYATYAPRYEGDEEYDVRTLVARFMD